MTAEAGHAANRSYTDQDGAFHLNGASFYNDAEADISASLEVLNSLAPAELTYLDGITAGIGAATKAVVLDANVGITGIVHCTTSNLLCTTATMTTASITNATVSGNFAIKRATVAAAGSAQGNAASITAGFTSVTASDGTKGVVMPAGTAGALVLVANTVAGQNLNVYPASGAAIDAGSANAAVTVAGSKTQLFVCDSSTQWWSILTA